MARLTPFHIIPALIAAASHAGEVTIELRPFSIEKSFTAAALPGGDCALLKIEPKAWTDFKITRVAEHGAKVSKGDVLIRFDSEDIDRKIEDTRREIASGALALAQAEVESKFLQETAPNKLETVRRAAEIAREENTYFTQIRRKASEESASQSLKRSEQILANQREELKQLSKMYEADDITENTEEIILVRQQDAVAAAEFALRMETLDHKRTLGVTLPREAKTLADSERDTAISLKKAETEIPRSIELGKLALDALKTTHQRARQSLTELEADRGLFEFKAAADGTFYHGAIENGRWLTGDSIKNLVLQGRPPLHAAFATFVPGAAKLGLVAFLDEATARALKPDLTGTAGLTGREEVEIPVKILQISAAPNPGGSYRVDLAATWPREPLAVTGATAQIRLISYQQAAAIALPSKALEFGTTGWTVEVKLADGKSERR
ncbi:MAG: hypothetical protein RLZZ214_3025, partial [Verrucomicrobiota bacterium]